MFTPWQLGMIDEAGYNGIREEQIERVAAAISATGLTQIDRDTFERCCWQCGVDPGNFRQTDLDRLENRLNA